MDEKLPHLLGDDSLNGLRTKRTNFIPLLKQAGYEEWTHEEKVWEVRAVLAAILGAERVLVSRECFNAVAGAEEQGEHSLLLRDPHMRH